MHFQTGPRNDKQELGTVDAARILLRHLHGCRWGLGLRFFLLRDLKRCRVYGFRSCTCFSTRSSTQDYWVALLRSSSIETSTLREKLPNLQHEIVRTRCLNPTGSTICAHAACRPFSNMARATTSPPLEDGSECWRPTITEETRRGFQTSEIHWAFK